jgi:hypothetical protein
MTRWKSAAVWRRLLLGGALLLITGCSSLPFQREPTPPGRTTLSSPRVQLPAELLGNLFVVEAKWDKFGPYRFVIDTGSSVTLVSPALVKRYAAEARAGEGRTAGARVRVAGADGDVLELPTAALSRLELGGARFDNVPVLVYDCATLSAHLGVRIDGVLGFPLFRETLLTLDYSGRRLELQPADSVALVPGTMVAFEDGRKTPLVRLRLGDVQFAALIDSGSDADFSLNIAGLNPAFLVPPRDGALVATIAGERPQRVGRLRDPLQLGDQAFAQPVVELTDALSSLGGGALRHFTVTFDQASGPRVFATSRWSGATGGAAPQRGAEFHEIAGLLAGGVGGGGFARGAGRRARRRSRGAYQRRVGVGVESAPLRRGGRSPGGADADVPQWQHGIRSRGERVRVGAVARQSSG